MKSRVSLVCTECGYIFPSDFSRNSCEMCGGILEYIWDKEYLKSVKFTGEIKRARIQHFLDIAKTFRES